jgi:P-type E1-E2 ATPase
VGVQRITMLSGDHATVANRIGAALHLDAVMAEQSPADKIAAVRAARAEGTTVMVGDGINDAPALAAADVGVAMGARGATASSEAADVVLLVDRLDRLALAMRIARRSRGIAVQSVVAGMGLSLIAMAIAAAGWLPPAPGALLQEGIDIAVILNALRALQGDDRERVPDSPLPGTADGLRAA